MTRDSDVQARCTQAVAASRVAASRRVSLLLGLGTLVLACGAMHAAAVRAAGPAAGSAAGPEMRAAAVTASGAGSKLSSAQVAAALMQQASTAQQTLPVGAARVLLAPRSADQGPPAAPHRTEALLKKAAQSNQWYASLLFAAQPEPLYAQPLTLRPTPAGLEIAYPDKQVVPTERGDTEIHYPHRADLTISTPSQAPWPAVLAKAGDWSIDIAMGPQQRTLRATAAHGSPYVQLRADGTLTLKFGGVVSRETVTGSLTGDKAANPSANQNPNQTADSRVLVLRLGQRRYALFGPSGVRWQMQSADTWLAELPPAASAPSPTPTSTPTPTPSPSSASTPGPSSYLAITALPDDRPETLALLARHAYAFIDDTQVSWAFDQASGRVTTRFDTRHRTLEGPDHGPLLGLYPHHWWNNTEVADKLGPTYPSVRGPIRLLAANSFTVQRRYAGFVPFWPGVSAQARGTAAKGRTADLAMLNDVLGSDVRNARRMMLEIGQGPYWQGKGLQRIAKVMDVAEQQGDLATRDKLLALLKGRIETWFSGDDRRTYFHLDRKLGTLVAYPEEYFSVQQMNDHHFHYGYWIRTIAEIALRDRDWASRERWGAMVDLMIADIASTDRQGAHFPFLRVFDPYESHSWASGIGLGSTGNNQESSSEAINAWAGLILWAEVTGDTALRDLGVWLYTSEIDAIEHYWFDVHKLVLAPEYRSAEVSMLFGGKYAHNTWWTDEPRQIKGINLLPITTASTYLGRHPEFTRRSLATLEPETAAFQARGKRADPPDIWQDLFAKYMALADPAAGLQQWDRWGAFELGDTRSHALHFMLSLAELGRPDLSVSADTTLYAVFRRSDGVRSYLAYNAGAAPISVRFSDGAVLQVAPGQLAHQLAKAQRSP